MTNSASNVADLDRRAQTVQDARHRPPTARRGYRHRLALNIGSRASCGGCTGDGRADDAEATDNILLTILASLSNDQRQRLMKMIANSSV